MRNKLVKFVMGYMAYKKEMIFFMKPSEEKGKKLVNKEA